MRGRGAHAALGVRKRPGRERGGTDDGMHVAKLRADDDRPGIDIDADARTVPGRCVMRVLLVDETRGRARVLRGALEDAGHDVVVSQGAPLALLSQVERVQPDVIIIDTESPTRDVLEHLVVMREHAPRPIVMFAQDAGRDAIRSAVHAGVSAYVVDGLDPARVNAIVDVACARFDDYQRLRAELADAHLKLSERKVLERAKGILMKRRGCDEGEAFAALRRLAMDRGKRLAQVAQQVIDADDLLG